MAQFVRRALFSAEQCKIYGKVKVSVKLLELDFRLETISLYLEEC